MNKHVVKPLHRQYVKNTENIKNTFSWLKNPKILRQIEYFGFRRAGTVHSNKLLCVKHYKKQTSGNCRLCKTNPETVHHILSNCPVLAKNQYIETIAANRPDLIYINKSNKTCTLFDFSLPWNTRINEKYGEKVSKYLPLASAMRYQMNLKSITIQPIIVGCLGSFSNRMKTELQNLHINITLEQLQVTAIEESSKILRFVLNIE